MLPTFNVTGSGLASIQSCFSRKQSHRCVLFFVQELLVAETAAINAHSFCYSVVRIIHHSFEKLIWERWLLQIFKQYVAQMALSRGRGSCWLFSCPVRLLFFLKLSKNILYMVNLQQLLFVLQMRTCICLLI